jgi:hypothetical protein
MRAAASPARNCVFFLSVALLLCSRSAATEFVSWNGEFRIHRDFARMTVTQSEAREQAFYFDVNGLVERTTLPSQEAGDVGKAAAALVGSTFRLVPAKSEANYLIQIRADRLTNYAIRNQKREPSSGQVMISLCHLPIADVAGDCGNLTFFYFATFRGVDVLNKVFPVWAEMTLRSSP